MLTCEDVLVGARVLRDLPRYLRHPFDLDEARHVIGRRLSDRASAALATFDAVAFRPAPTPFRRLTAHAGWRREDARASLETRGVEETLDRLYADGVYLTASELKGRADVRRGSLVFRVEPAELVRPGAVVHGRSASSGSRGAPTVVPIDLSFIRDHAVNTHLTLDAHGGRGWAHAHWGVPGGTAVTNPLEFAMGGTPAERWFTPVPIGDPGLSARYRVGARALRAASALAGVPFPRPELATPDDPLPLVRWLRRVLDRGVVPHVWTFASSAVLACRAAEAAGIEITGARFTCGGEPTTAARRAAIERAGAVALPRYGATETDILAFACRAPVAPDEQHFFTDRHAVIQPDADTRTKVPPDTLFFTSLLPSAPFPLLNVSLGDVSVLERRACGCPLEALGWNLHIRRIRSYEKLTAGGIAFLDVDVTRILEEVLPGRFGGRPDDYQLLEDPGESPPVWLLVDPSVGPMDANEVRKAFLAEIGRGDGGERLMALQWSSAGMPAVRRARPRRTESGKIHHLHVV